MFKNIPVFVWATLTAWQVCAAAPAPVATAKSSDGGNVINLYTDPLSYEVLRKGKVVVAKSEIGLKIDGKCIAAKASPVKVERGSYSGKEASPINKKASIDLSANWVYADFGDWGVRIVARNDGVAYRFETAMAGKIKIDDERVDFAIPSPEARCWLNYTDKPGCEETVTKGCTAAEIITCKGTGKMIYLPIAYRCNGATVLMTESDVRDYPVLNFTRPEKKSSVVLGSYFSRYPLETAFRGKREGDNASARGRWQSVVKSSDYLVVCEGKRTLPWRVFVIASVSSKLCEADIVSALAPPADKGADFSWVKPGKVAWDWWNCFDNKGQQGCNTATYKRFVDFAASNGIEYVILDEGWSAYLDIWNDNKAVDVPEIIKHADKKGVGIILWMAWSQLVDNERKVAEHFSRLGAKGFKVDFMDRGDAAVVTALEKFVKECAATKMIVDYHGVYRPVGLHRKYPNLVNYEGVHGLEQMKWHKNNYDFMLNDIRVFFLRMTAGPMDYTPGAMRNFVRGTYDCEKNVLVPGSYGTRARQMAMMALFEAPLQMLCDSPTNYEKNMESFRFMAATPVVWDDTVAIGGTPDTYAAAARKAKDGSWYAAGINNWDYRGSFEFRPTFLGEGEWKAEIFRDAKDSMLSPESYIHEKLTVKSDTRVKVPMSGGGGFVVRFTK